MRGGDGSAARRRAAIGVAGPFVTVLLLPSPSEQWSLLADPRPEVVVGAIAVLVATTVAWLLVAWAALMCAAAVGSRLPGASGAAARRLLTAITPVVLRRVVMTAAGMSVAAGLAACGSPGAVAAPPTATATVVAASTATGTDAFDIDLDWPVVGSVTEAPLVSAARLPATEEAAASPSSTSGIGAPDMTPFRATLDAPADAPTPASALASPRSDRDSSTTDPRAVEAPPVMAATTGVVVQPGDSLWSIAAAQLPGDAAAARIDAAWRDWYRANRDIIGPNPNLVIPGQVLYAPDEGTEDVTAAGQETDR